MSKTETFASSVIGARECRVIRHHGITLNLLAEVKTQCLIAIAQRDSK